MSDVAALFPGRTWYPTNSTPLPFRRAKSGLPRDRNLIHRAHAGRRHALPVATTRQDRTAMQSVIAATVWSLGNLLFWGVVVAPWPVLYGLGV